MIINFPYIEMDNLDQLPHQLWFWDHIGGFDHDRNNSMLDQLQQYAVSQNKNFSVKIVQVVEPDLVEKYNRLDLDFDFAVQNRKIWEPFLDYNTHPDIAYKNFVCSFNGSPHVSRKLLVSVLHHFGWYNPEYVSKNFAYSADMLDGHLIDHVDHESSFYRKFFINHRSENFFQTVNSFGHVREDHTSNICALEHKLTQSFLHVVSETMATSYYPFVTEKFLYSVVTRGLFLAYAQPGWHQHLEKYYGIKRYTKLFDYRFDEIQNPVERLLELMSMISKFSTLTTDDWRDLYLLEQDTIEYNYNHYFSKNYLKSLEKFR
jgi:hypothetical protein